MYSHQNYCTKKRRLARLRRRFGGGLFSAVDLDVGTHVSVSKIIAPLEMDSRGADDVSRSF